jgi:surfactin synthase thioesterase subunit
MTEYAHPVSRWVGTWRQPGPVAETIVFCLPHAGGAASSFRPWFAAFPQTIAICPIHLPGREDRIRETPAFEIPAIADVIGAVADRPYVILGHSMGAWIGFDVVRVLRERQWRLPDMLIVSAADPPDQPDAVAARLAGLETSVLVRELASLGGGSDVLMANPELLSLVLPAIRSDLRWITERKHRAEPPLAVPICAFAGIEDPITTVESMRGWARHTDTRFQLHALRGGHFAPHADPRHVGALIGAELA